MVVKLLMTLLTSGTPSCYSPPPPPHTHKPDVLGLYGVAASSQMLGSVQVMGVMGRDHPRWPVNINHSTTPTTPLHKLDVFIPVYVVLRDYKCMALCSPLNLKRRSRRMAEISRC